MFFLGCSVGTTVYVSAEHLNVACETQELEINLARVAVATYCIIQCSFRTVYSECLYYYPRSIW